jgi:hypothetical protein
MKRISRRDFHRLAVVGAVATPLAGIPGAAFAQEQATEAKLGAKPVLTPEQTKKVQEAVAKRDEQLAGMRGHTLPYGLEPAFIFRARAATRRAAKG